MITKDKQYLILTVEGKANPYRFNFTDGTVYGLRGAPVKNFPSALKTAIRQEANTSNLLGCMSYLIGWWSAEELRKEKWRDMFALFDRMDSYYISNKKEIQVLSFNRSVVIPTEEQLTYAKKNFKKLMAYLEKNPTDRNPFSNFLLKVEREKRLKELGVEIDGHYITSEMWAQANFLNTPYLHDKHYMKLTLEYLASGLHDYCKAIGRQGLAMETINSYFSYCTYLNIKPEKGNIMKLYANTKRDYLTVQEQRENEKFTYYQSAQKEALTFEDDDYIVLIPTEAQELVQEGQRQGNCVGGYANSVRRNHCHIVFVRKKSNPTKNYITCEVYANGYGEQYCGKIGQFLLAHNSRNLSDSDIAFKEKYAKHIAEHWLKATPTFEEYLTMKLQNA